MGRPIRSLLPQSVDEGEVGARSANGDDEKNHTLIYSSFLVIISFHNIILGFPSPRRETRAGFIWSLPRPGLRRKWGICSPLWGRSHTGGCSEDLRREWGIRSPLWGRSHTDGCSKDPSRPSRLKEGSQDDADFLSNEGSPRKREVKRYVVFFVMLLTYSYLCA